MSVMDPLKNYPPLDLVGQWMERAEFAQNSSAVLVHAPKAWDRVVGTVLQHIWCIMHAPRRCVSVSLRKLST